MKCSAVVDRACGRTGRAGAEKMLEWRTDRRNLSVLVNKITDIISTVVVAVCRYSIKRATPPKIGKIRLNAAVQNARGHVGSGQLCLLASFVVGYVRKRKHSKARRSTAQHGTVPHRTAGHDTARHRTALRCAVDLAKLS